MSEILRKDLQFVWHPFTQMKTAGAPLEIIRAKDSLLYSADGKEYIDANSSWWVNVHGHGNEKIGNAIAEQFKKLDHVIFAGVTHPPAVKLSEEVVKLLGDPFSKVFFSDDGSTAVEVALKMAFQFWFNAGKSKKRILALDGAYHGDTFGAMAVGQRGYFNEPFEHFFFKVDYLEFPLKEIEDTLIEQALTLFQSGEFAALILEPLVQGSSGMKMYSADFLTRLVSVARENDVLVIFDEVMTGWGRTGKMFAFNHFNLYPDIICLSKGLTGGVLPMGLTVTNEKIFAGFLSDEKSKALLHGHSYTANALACAAALASIELFKSPELWGNIDRINRNHLSFSKQIMNLRNVENVRVMGTIFALDIKVTEESGYFSSIRDEAYQHMIDHGVLLRPLGNCLFINPPYCIKDEELERIYDAIITFVKKRLA